MSKVYVNQVGPQDQSALIDVTSIIQGINVTLPAHTSSLSNLTTRIGAEETKVQCVALGGTGATTATAARTALGAVGTATNATPFGAFNSSAGATSLVTSVTLTPTVQCRALVLCTFVGNGTLTAANITTTQGSIATSQFNFVSAGSGFGVVNLTNLTSTTISLNLTQTTSAGIFAGIVILLFPYT